MRKPPIEHVRGELRARVRPARNLDEYVHRPDFLRAFEKATANEAESIIALLTTGPLDAKTYDAVREWTAEILKRGQTLAEMSHRELEALCKQHNVPVWSRMSSPQMIDALKQRGIID